MTTAWVHIEMSSMLNRLHRLHVTAILAVLLPLLLFPELLFFNQSIFFMDLAWYHYPLRAYIADAWRAGTAAVETLVLPYVYADLSPLVQTA